MSTFAVKVYQIAVEPHPDPETESLECAKVGDFRVVVGKGQYKDGDTVAYIPQDAIVPDDLIKELGLEGRLAGKDKNRVKAVKLRGQISQGLVYAMPDKKLGANVTEELGITKYEPPIPVGMSGQTYSAVGKTLKFDIENIKLNANAIADDEEVVVTEKIHGTWTCLGFYQNEPIVTSKGLSTKGLAMITDEGVNVGNIYVQQFRKYQEQLAKLKEHLKPTKCTAFYVLGETFGQGIQDMTYDRQGKEFMVFDIYVGKPGFGKYLDYEELREALIECGLTPVPELAILTYDKQKVYELANEDKSTLADCIREGVVVKPLKERYNENGRVIFKNTSDAYDLRKGKKLTEYQ